MKKNYILLLLAFMLSGIGGMAQKMSPQTELLLLKHSILKDNKNRKAVRAVNAIDSAASTREVISAYVSVTDFSAFEKLRRLGCSVNTIAGNIATVNMPVDLLEKVCAVNGIDRIEAATEMKLLNAHTRKVLGVNNVHKGSAPGQAELPEGFTGRGVVVGMIDVGFEFRHAVFRDMNDPTHTRIKRVWNQTSYGKTPAGYDYGAEYADEASILKLTTDAAEYHGTHTSCTAAGASMGSDYYGMAPEADIVLVSVDLRKNTAVTDAAKYIFDYAESQGMPAVVNMSLGSHIGPHDGRSLMDQSFEQLAGPGRILVGAVGNEALENMHCSKTFTETDCTLKTMIAYSDNANKSSYTYIWASPDTDFSVEVALVDPTKKGRVIKTSGEIKSGAEAQYYPLSEDGISDLTALVTGISVADNNSRQMAIESTVYGLADNRKQAIIIHGEPGQTVHLWQCANYAYFVNGGIKGFTDGDNLCSAGEIGGTADAVISVGSFDAEETFFIPGVGYLDIKKMMNEVGYDFNTGERSVFSSRGPTADGRIKPDVMAPGNLIISAYNKNAGSAAFIADYLPTVKDPEGETYYYDMAQGTSQAAPAVTGIVALWLQANPNLSPDDVRNIIKATATRDDFTGADPNNDYGYGKINAYNGILAAIGKADAVDAVVAADNRAHVWVEKGTRNIYCVAPGTNVARVFTVSGRSVGTYALSPDHRTIDASAFVPGLYIVSVAGQSFKVLIR